MDAMEAQVNLKDLEKDLMQGLENANSNESDAKGGFMGDVALKPVLNLGSPLIKVFCRIKNNTQFKMVTKGLSENVKDQLQHFCEVKDQEITVYKSALDQYGSEHLSPELIAMINKYANSPLAPLIEFEIEKFNLMKAEVKLLVAAEGKGEA